MLRFAIRLLMFLSFALAIFGVLIISYASKSQGQAVGHYLFMQSVFVVIGLIVGIVAYHWHYRLFRSTAWLWVLCGGSLALLCAVLIPGIGREVNGSWRWIQMGPVNLQPSEFVKLAVVIGLSAYLSRVRGVLSTRWGVGFLVPLAGVGAVMGLLYLQPDFGSMMIVGGLAGAILLVAGVGWKKCALVALIGVLAVGALLISNPNRRARLLDDHAGGNHQAQQSEIALRNGGVFGQGLGQGMQREYYLPEPHTDFIFAIIGEDLGLVATSLIWLAFLAIFGGGMVITFRAKDRQGMLLAFGCTLMLGVQGSANMAVVTHLFPTKGLALPFLSYGGSSLIASFATMGLLLSVARQTLEDEANAPLDRRRPISLE